MSVIGKTKSVCPSCLKVIAAELVERNGKVYMEKTCEAHGAFSALLSSDYERYKFAKELYPNPQKQMINNCPSDCGLCPSHAQHTCLAVIEVTKNCNLHCGTCFASAETQQEKPGSEPDLEAIRGMFKAVLKSEGTTRPVQLSGGEPLMRKDLPEIIAAGREVGFDHIEVNTNGIALARDLELTKRLAQAGLNVVYLQFDGVNDEVYARLRGQNLLSLKMQAIENCERNGIAVTLVPTIVKGVNDDQLGDIIRLAMAKKNITGVNFQPVTFLGRYPQAFCDPSDRVTIPDLVKGIAKQMDNALSEDDFYPIPCPHPQCSALTLALADKDHIFPLTRLVNVKAMVGRVMDPAGVVPVAISKLWSLRPQDDVLKAIQSFMLISDLTKEGGGVKSKLLTVSMMAFQDCWTIDLERLQKCCIHVVTTEGKLVPFCARYLTGKAGQRLYP